MASLQPLWPALVVATWPLPPMHRKGCGLRSWWQTPDLGSQHYHITLDIILRNSIWPYIWFCVQGTQFPFRFSCTLSPSTFAAIQWNVSLDAMKDHLSWWTAYSWQNVLYFNKSEPVAINHLSWQSMFLSPIRRSFKKEFPLQQHCKSSEQRFILTLLYKTCNRHKFVFTLKYEATKTIIVCNTLHIYIYLFSNEIFTIKQWFSIYITIRNIISHRKQLDANITWYLSEVVQ